MTREAAIEKARAISESGVSRGLVVFRPDHPYTGATFYAIREEEKLKWTPTERLIAVFVRGEEK